MAGFHHHEHVWENDEIVVQDKTTIITSKTFIEALCGCNQPNFDSIDVVIVRESDGIHEIRIFMKCSNGRIFTLPATKNLTLGDLEHLRDMKIPSWLSQLGGKIDSFLKSISPKHLQSITVLSIDLMQFIGDDNPISIGQFTPKLISANDHDIDIDTSMALEKLPLSIFARANDSPKRGHDDDEASSLSPIRLVRRLKEKARLAATENDSSNALAVGSDTNGSIVINEDNRNMPMYIFTKQSELNPSRMIRKLRELRLASETA